MFQEPHVIFTEQPNVIDAVFKNGWSFNAHAKGEACILVGIYITVLQDIGMDHTAAEDLDPACFFTNVATYATAYKTAHIHFRARFGKWELRRPEAHLYVFPIHFFYKKIKCLFEIGE